MISERREAQGPRVETLQGLEMSTTEARTDYMQVADSDGRLWLIPAATRNHLLANGISSLTVTIGLNPAQPPQPWLTVSEAARLHVSDVDGINLRAATMKIPRACTKGQIVCSGTNSRRRIEPNSLDAWRLEQREKNLDRRDQLN